MSETSKHRQGRLGEHILVGHGPAYERALANGKPAILHYLIDPETISPTTTREK